MGYLFQNDLLLKNIIILLKMVLNLEAKILVVESVIVHVWTDQDLSKAIDLNLQTSALSFHFFIFPNSIRNFLVGFQADFEVSEFVAKFFIVNRIFFHNLFDFYELFLLVLGVMFLALELLLKICYFFFEFGGD